jgi:hypothetical protein
MVLDGVIQFLVYELPRIPTSACLCEYLEPTISESFDFTE